MEIFFLSDLICNFFVEYIPAKTEENKEPIRDFVEIGTRYLKGQFLFDFIPILPLHLVYLPYNLSRLFYLVKMIRVKRVMKVLKKNTALDHIK